MTPYRVAIDLRMVGRQPHGIARYAIGLWNALPARPDLRFLALVRPEGRPQVGLRRPSDEILTTRTPFLSASEQLEMPLRLQLAKADLLHATSFAVPVGWRGPLVLSLHDLTHLSHPAARAARQRAFYRAVVGPAARRAARVLTVSDYSRRQIVDWLSVPEARITVVANAVDLPVAQPAPLRADPPLLLALGNGKRHKNLELLLAAMPRLASPARLRLVGDGLERFRRPGVQTGGRVDDVELASLYASATLFLCPSRAEGFGLPPLEAARCGTPVVVAATSALSEIWSGVAPTLSPEDPAAWATEIDRLLADRPARRALAAACRARADHFASWEPLAQAAIDAYRGALGRVVGRGPI